MIDSLIFFSLLSIALITWFYFKGKKLDKESEYILERLKELEKD